MNPTKKIILAIASQLIAIAYCHAQSQYHPSRLKLFQVSGRSYYRQSPVFVNQSEAFNKTGTFKALSSVYQLNWNDSLKNWSDTSESYNYLTYNSDGSPATGTVYTWNSSILTRFVVSEFQRAIGAYPPGWPDAVLYDPLNYIIQQRKNGNWVNSGKTYTVKDANNNIIDIIRQSWDGASWINTQRTQTTYISSTMDTVVNYAWNGSKWVNQNRSCNYYYKSLSTGSFGEVWDSVANKWVVNYGSNGYSYCNQVSYIEDGNGKVTSAIRSHYIRNNTWHTDWIYHFVYDANNELSTMGDIGYDSTGFAGENDSFINITWEKFVPIEIPNYYDFLGTYRSAPFLIGGEDFKTYQQSHYFPDSGKQVAIYKEIQQFDANGRITLRDIYQRDSKFNLQKTKSISFDYYPNGHPDHVRESVADPKTNQLKLAFGDDYQANFDADGDITDVSYVYYDSTSKSWKNAERDTFEYQTFSGIENYDDKSKIFVYPNPVANTLYIESQQIPLTQAEIMDAGGKLIIAAHLDKSVSKVDVSGLKPGFYILSIQTENGSIYKKFIK